MMTRRAFLAAALASGGALASGAALASGCVGARPGAGRALDRRRLGASTACLAGYPLIEALDVLARLGFGTVEIIAYTGASHSVGEIPGFSYREASAEERARVYRATRAFRHVSAHLPFHEMQLWSPDAAERQAGIDRLRDGLDTLAFLEGELAVVHPGWPGEGRTYRDVWPQMLDTFRRLGDEAARRGLRIGLETMQPDSVRAYTDLLFEIDHPAVGATLDTGHIRGATDIGLPPEERDSAVGRQRFNDVLDALAEGLGEKLFHLHLTDVRAGDWRDHQAVGTGIIDFPRLFRTLKERRFDGLLVFELEEPDQLQALRSSKALVERLMAA